MAQFDYDYFVIGAGSGGVRSARIAAAHGARVAIAEEYRVGGTCVIRGCVPKKLLVTGAHFAEDLGNARHYGWTLQGAEFSWPVLRDAVAQEVDRLNGLYQNTLDKNHVETFLARARLVGPHRVEVAGKTVTAAHVLVATGARPHVPDIPGAELGITSNEVFHLEALPRRILIVGAGYIANEFAGVFAALGVEVTIAVHSDIVLRGWDRAMAERLVETYQEKGIRFVYHVEPERLEKTAGALRLTTTTGDSFEADAVLWATGRVPNTGGIGLAEAGATLGRRGEVAVDDAYNCGPDWLHAVGDVTDHVQLTPVAIREGHALADRLFGGTPRTIDYSLIPSAVFSSPPIASVGLTEEKARAQYGDVTIHKAGFRPLTRIFADKTPVILYKLVAEKKSGRIVGAHLFGPGAPEILQAFAVAVQAGLTKAQLDRTVALHPTMAEELVLMS